jgi:hypothetical protein
MRISSTCYILKFLVVTLVSFGLVYTSTARADLVAQPAPFTQNWSNAALITTNNDWNGSGNSSEVIAPTSSDTPAASDYQFGTIENPTQSKSAEVVTWKGSQDDRWSNPGNWEGGCLPGTSDVARFDANSGTEVLVDADSSGIVAGLILDPDYHGTLSLDRDLVVSNDLVIAGGTLNQGSHHLRVSRYRQTGGTFTGGDASLIIEYEAAVSGGTLLTSKSITCTIADDQISRCLDDGHKQQAQPNR